MKKNVTSFLDREINDLEMKMKQSKKWFVFFSIVLMVINLSMVVIAGVIIKDLSQESKNGSNVGLILASFAAVVVILIFFLQFVIVFYKSQMKGQLYKEACDEIQVEVMKFNNKKDEYAGKDSEEVLSDKVNTIKSAALEHRRHKSMIQILLNGFGGGEDE